MNSTAYVRKVLRNEAENAFAISPYSKLCISISHDTDPLPKTSLTWTVNTRPLSIENEYQDWISTRTAPLFGEYPDAKVLDLARLFEAPKDCPLLDVGAGTGRSTLPLARLGHQSDAVEIAPALPKILREDAAKKELNVTVFEGEILDASLPIPTTPY
jgi:SAM-dependent methyltransferase